MKLRHVKIHDGTQFDFQDKRVVLDQYGHPIVWHVEHIDEMLTTDPYKFRPAFWITYLEGD